MKTYYAIRNFAYYHFNFPMIASTDGVTSKDRYEEYGDQVITEVTKLKGKMVEMPNGRKAAMFKVGNEVWARYSDGSCDIVEAAPVVEEVKVAKSEKRVAKPTKKAIAFFNASNNFEEFAAMMIKDGYNEKYTLIQWNLCK
ncbi:hypothetical protein AU156_gp098 [Edwardsiella phage PEi20]|uniref:Uncharacterized protein n=1 Tax=Edwardsiella phage PEi20 TaxID=1608310 RepID=A0A0B6VNM5_9CAUD|nr:hypothetical protein AU156_gp098 [Edwardsiella phage PEi20]BAQ22748.1 conserved hypothetical protein [Edwardsiella phage PEi20]